MKNLLHVSVSEGLFNCRIKYYPDESGQLYPVEKMVSAEKLFNPYGLERIDNDYHTKHNSDSCVETDIKSSESSSDRAVVRARSKVLDLIRCNCDFRYFCTLTFNDDIVKRDDYSSVLKKFSQWCDNRVRRCGLKYVAVIERHKKSNGLHFHLLANDVLRLCDSGTVTVPGKKKPVKVSTADRYKVPMADRKTVYNIADWSYGFSTAIEITGDPQRIKVSAYLQKYLTKEGEKVGGRWYYSGGDLARPVYRYCDCDFSDSDYDYEIKFPGNTIKVVKI